MDFKTFGLGKLSVVCGITLFAVSLNCVSAEEPAIAQRDAVECVPRGGLPNVAARLRAGEDVRVAYFGGSITEAPGWRIKSLDWMKKRYPNAKLSEINAAIGGTGSDLGVFRLQHDVLAKKPHLLFVEFAVNDGGADPAQIVRCFEGIVRQTWQADPTTDICFVYTTSEPFYRDLKAGKASRSASAMEAVAEHYGIPSLQLALDVVQLDASGKLIFKGPKPATTPNAEDPILFSTDGVHPLDGGHEIYAQTIARSWPKLTTSATSTPHSVPVPLRADNWEQAKMIPITKAMLHGAWNAQDMKKDHPAKHFQARIDQLWKTNEAGATLEFDFEGQYAAIYDVLGPEGGMLDIQVDGATTRKLDRMDGYCVWTRLSTLPVVMMPETRRHHVKVTLLADKLDKAQILFPDNRADLEKNPQKYADHAWYVGGLMILGKLVE